MNEVERRPARASMVRSGAQLIREHGVSGVGLREIVTHSKGPRGSLHRYFPGGKTQLVAEAIDLAVAELSEGVEVALARAVDRTEAVAIIVSPWRRTLLDHDFALGCPLAAAVVDMADNDVLREHSCDKFARWRQTVAATFVRLGDSETNANDLATVLLASIEGAMVLARAQRRTDALDAVQRYFSSPTRSA